MIIECSSNYKSHSKISYTDETKSNTKHNSAIRLHYDFDK